MPARRRKKDQPPERIDAALRRDQVVHYALLGVPGVVIARELGVRPETISRILNEPAVRARIEAARATAIADGRADLQASTRWLTTRLLELAASRNGGVAVRAVVEALSKLGFDAPKRVDLGILAGSTDDELWNKLEDLKRKRIANATKPADAHALEADAEREDGDG